MDERFREKPYSYSTHLGMHMVDWSEGYARFEMPLAEHHQNRHGNPHGGVHASLLDTVMGYAGCWTGDPEVRQMALTLTLNVSYLSRPRGTLLIGEGRKTGGGRSTFFAEASVTDETGELIATGSGVFRYRRGGA
ncbi:PaaI family thioesterase [Aestuariicoccus sp. MJ-SS9]|nr:PaaI family thioesterase [Aestuariicoccus sp. MJ-SS9]MDU8909876.1 PaaI family thioesterase [Aestuariicoccus sp. MJ-SS9]